MAGASEKPRFYSRFLTNLQTLMIFMQRQPLSTTFSLTIWDSDQYLVLYLSSHSNTAAPCAVLWYQLDARCDVTILAPALRQGCTTENVPRIMHALPCYKDHLSVTSHTLPHAATGSGKGAGSQPSPATTRHPVVQSPPIEKGEYNHMNFIKDIEF